jgi:predicted nucleic acid-binding protein
MAHSGMVIETTILIHALRSQPIGPGMTFFRHTVITAKCYVAYSTVYELYVGATTPAKVQAIDDILAGLEVLVGTQTSARRAGLLRRELLRRNLDIGPLDVLIAAACLEADLPLLTTNSEHFLHVPSLTVLYPDLLTPTANFADVVALSRARNRLSRQH